MPPRLLLVEDDEAVRNSLEEALLEEGVPVEAAGHAEEALARLAEFRPDVVLSDIRMPGLDGIELLQLLKERAPEVGVILMTAYEDMPTVARAMREGAFDFLVKPLKVRDLLAVLERVDRDQEARRRAAGPGDHPEADGHDPGATEEGVPGAGHEGGLETLVGRHPLMIEVYKRVGQVAASRVSVLLLGETGTGKERVARAIHHHSEATEEPFIAVNCAALPETLLESELFGHVRGAFTGAVADRRGRFALAGRGTLLLDEIGDTTPAFQSKLLRVLEEGTFFPVGAETEERTEARVLAATHGDLPALVAEGPFRQDLYYRLRGVEIRIPPLRERVSDIPLLARHFIRKAAATRSGPEPLLPQETLEVLLVHDWPGNVRELENSLTRAVVLCSGDVIRPEHLGLVGSGGTEGERRQGGVRRKDRTRKEDRAEGDDRSRKEDRAPATHQTPGEDRTPEEGQGRVAAGEPGTSPALGALLPLHELERVQLERALAATGGNRTRTAEILGISRPRLYRMLEKHGLD